MKKKLLSMLLVSVMAMSVLAGCGNQEGEGGQWRQQRRRRKFWQRFR